MFPRLGEAGPAEWIGSPKPFPWLRAGASNNKFEPDVILVYGNPSQLMMLMCGLQKVKYQRFEFHFIGEGACAERKKAK